MIAVVQQALDQFDDPARLGEISPLAAPYFLGQALADSSEGTTAVGRGRVLQQVLLEAALALDIPGETEQQNLDWLKAQGAAGNIQFLEQYRRSLLGCLREGTATQRLLYWSYFHQPRFATLELVFDQLTLAKATYFRQRRRALEQLAGMLIQRIHPALRLETPAQPTLLLGRESDLQICLTAVHTRQTLALVGPSGIGKTSLGAAVVQEIAPRPGFWYTVRLGLNDNVRHVLFALGCFLHRHGAGGFWLQLIADAEQSIARSVDMIRHDLAQFDDTPPLLCFDEVDLLRPAEVEAHARMFALLESLRGAAPILCIGQTIPFETHSQHRIGSLEPVTIRDMLASNEVHLTAPDLVRLAHETQGNPRLIWLFITLHHSGEPLEKVLTEMVHAPSVEYLIQRIWSRLTDEERAALHILAVFRQFAPQDMDRLDATVLNRLDARHLLVRDARGGVAIVPALREMLYRLITPEVREEEHRYAATVRAVRGEWTAAAYHLIRAGMPEHAIQIWAARRAEEIGQGQSEAALALFNTISGTALSPPVREQLHVLRAELWKLTGEYQRALAEVHTRVWVSPHLSARAKRIQGNIEELKDQFDQALRSYQQGIETIQYTLASEAAWLYKGRARVSMRDRDFEQAWHEALRARYEVEEVQGQIAEDQGQFDRARGYYEETLRLAQECRYPRGEAKSHHNLARLLFVQGQFDVAREHSEQAYRLFKRMGDSASQASVLVNRALGYNLAHQPAQVLPHAEEAYRLFDQLGEPWGRAVAAQNLAEAYYALEHLDAAEKYARLVLDEEDQATLPDGLRVLGEIQLARGNLPLADQLIRESLAMARRNTDRFLEAYGWRALGRVALAQNDIRAARTALDQAMHHFQDLDLPREVAATQVLLPPDEHERSVAE
jgi:tetratricopeptide (TPR) repeat protein